jgi:hypothetical protein
LLGKLGIFMQRIETGFMSRSTESELSSLV